MFLAEKARLGVRRRAPPARGDDVELPRRPDRQPPARPGARRDDGHRPRRCHRRWSGSPSAAPTPRLEVDCTALFSFIGAEPNSAWLDGVAVDEHGFVLTDRALDARRARRGVVRDGPPPAAVRDELARACSPSATSARARPSGSPPPSARDPRRSVRCTSTSPSPSTPDGGTDRSIRHSPSPTGRIAPVRMNGRLPGQARTRVTHGGDGSSDGAIWDLSLTRERAHPCFVIATSFRSKASCLASKGPLPG